MKKLAFKFQNFIDENYIYVIASIAALGGFLFGFDIGVISSAILFVSREFHLTPLTNGLVVSSVMFGALCGSLIAGELADYFGRKLLILAVAVIFIIGSIITASIHVLEWLICGRVIIGLAIGITSVVTPLYLSEIAPSHRRGAVVSFNQLFITLGIGTAYVVAYLCAFSANWREMLELGIIPALVLFFGAFFIPESPRWLLANSRENEALSVLGKVRSKFDVSEEFSAIKNNLSDSRNDWQVLIKLWVLPAITIGLGLAFFQQFIGVNTIIYYAPTILEIAGFKYATSAILATLGVGVISILFTVIALFLVDRWGRRPLLLVGLVGMIVSLWVLGVTVNNTTGVMRFGALFGMTCYLFCFSASFGSLVWLLVSELFPLRVRGKAISLIVAANWGFNMVVAFSFLSLVRILKPNGVFMLYSVIAILAWLFVYFLVPETKGVSLECIEANLRAGKKGRELGER